ncbi:hypothetical protein [Rhizobium leguminosarum]|uniref:hypothetical protein n=1 Tax=Rhizobium leguminosarum TaxID=384 RepID=UPI001FE02E00|nr:hypothetical protein [Rhizobium leguminosarum]
MGIQDVVDRERTVVGGLQDSAYMRNALAHPFVPTDVDHIEQEVGDRIAGLRAYHSEIAMLLFECTGFPIVAKALRRKTRLPIYDITDLCKLTLSTVVNRDLI